MAEPILMTLLTNTLWAIYEGQVEKLSDRSAARLIRSLRNSDGFPVNHDLMASLVRCWTQALTHFCRHYDSKVRNLKERYYLADMRQMAQDLAKGGIASDLAKFDEQRLIQYFADKSRAFHQANNTLAAEFIEARLGAMPEMIRHALAEGLPPDCPDWSTCFSLFLTEDMKASPRVYQIFSAERLASIEEVSRSTSQTAQHIEEQVDDVATSIGSLSSSLAETSQDVKWIVSRLQHLSSVSDKELFEVGAFFGIYDLDDPADVRKVIEAKAQELGVLKERVVQHEKAERELSKIAFTDHLTGAPNRAHFHNAMLECGRRFGGDPYFQHVIFIDIDNFYQVNNNLGHDIGDVALIETARRLARIAELHEVDFCRYGGDEFILGFCASDEDKARATLIAEDLLRGARETVLHKWLEINLTLSAGIAIERHSVSIDRCIKSADLALGQAKGTGRDRYHVYEPELLREAEERRLLRAALEDALENGEMHLQYQPIVRSVDARLLGFEALLRWVHPKFGPIPPAKFIPLAEDSRLIRPIGAWVLNTACREALRWDQSLRVNINVSTEQLEQPNIVDIFASALADSGLPADRLELDVTESAFMYGKKRTQALEEILALGVRLSLDDFGTGYSSLGYLTRIRFSSIKVDRSFVAGAARGQREAIAMIRGLVAMADALGMETVAEGVETAEEYQQVQALGFTMAQGYYFGKPMLADAAATLAARNAEV